MSSKKPIKLFFWSSILFEKKPHENYGDLLSKYLVEKISGRKVMYYNAPKKRKAFFQQKHLLAIGSIMSYATKKSMVWGSGIITKKDTFSGGTFYAVRGPRSRERVLELGFKCPEVYGDPALLLPDYYRPANVKKSHTLGIIPHYVDYPKVAAWYQDKPDVKVIDLIGNDVEAITRKILSCERTVSSSLHGVIVSHAYGIPSVWVRFSDKLTGDNVKFEDYFLSVGLQPYTGMLIEDVISFSELESFFNISETLPEKETLEIIKERLLKAFPKM